MTASGGGESGQRIDVWLWRARFFRSRTLAARAVLGGGVRIERQSGQARLEKPGASVRIGDRLSFAGPDGAVRVVTIAALGARRGPASEAAGLYAEMAPAAARPASKDNHAARVGRPTEKDRRAIDRLHGEDDI